MTLEEIKEILVENGYENSVVFENPDYADAFVGFTHDGKAVYDYDKMIDCLKAEEDMDYDDAVDFISYNTMRALPYMGDMAPVITIFV